MDFIIKLLELKDLISKDAFDSILVIVNRLTKYFYIILFKEIYIAKQLKYIILNKIIRYYGILKEITSN